MVHRLDWYVWIDSSLKLKNNFDDLPASIYAAGNPLVFSTLRINSIRKGKYRKHMYKKVLAKRYTGEPTRIMIHYRHPDLSIINEQVVFWYHQRIIGCKMAYQKYLVTQCQILALYFLERSDSLHIV